VVNCTFVAARSRDGEVVAGDGSEGIQAVFEARHRPGSPMAFAAFDLLELDGHSVMGESWTARGKRLALIGALTPPGPPRTMPAIACTLEGG
jgi:hypothetical protein